jgi:LmbE family N-acetylglucosaminyl deacetylase
MKTILAISSHLDDLVLGAGQFMAGRPDVLAVTVLAGDPAHDILTSYDASCGFKTSKQAVEARRFEDAEATSVLEACHKHLPFVDSQYGKLKVEPIVKQLNKLLDEIGSEIEFVLANLGVHHPDHVAVREAVLEAMRDRPIPLWLYEDLPARVQHPASVARALNALRDKGYELELGFIGTGPIDKKMDALWCYRSQMGLPEFENRHELLVGERFWRINKAVTPEKQV